MNQLQQLMSFKEIFLCYDNDNAGLKALFGDEKKTGIIEMLQGTGVRLNRIIVPRGKDPNTMTRHQFNNLFVSHRKIG